MSVLTAGTVVHVLRLLSSCRVIEEVYCWSAKRSLVDVGERVMNCPREFIQKRRSATVGAGFRKEGALDQSCPIQNLQKRVFVKR